MPDQGLCSENPCWVPAHHEPVRQTAFAVILSSTLLLWLTIHTQRASRFSNTSNHAYVPLNSFPFMLPNS